MSTLITEHTNLRTFKFLGHNLELWCFDKDLLFLVNFMTMVELNGSDYWDTFKSLNTDAINLGNHMYIPIEITTHINSHIIVYDRDRKIDSILV
tara:strand:+ start:1866 stop:2147 length:282 start_codon:yes stop_codon:yes gene_type:complete